MNKPVRKIRILRIIARMNIGGPAIQVTNLMLSLPDSRFEQLLVSGSCGSNEKDYLETKNVQINVRRIEWLGRALNPISDFFALFEIMRVIKNFQPDIIHTHTFKAGLIGRIAAVAQPRRILLVHTFHGHLLHGYFGSLGTRIVIMLERWLALRTTRLISVGTKVKNELLEQGIGVPTQYKVIKPGFNIVIPKLISRMSYNFAEEDFICGWFGRITKIKRVDRVIEIATIAKSSGYKNVKFLIVGDGEERKKFEAQAVESELPIIFLGWRSDIPDLMKLCNIVFCTSENEGTPISLIEAQMLGRPVVATNVGSVHEVLISGKTGFVLDYQPQNFWEKMRFLIDNTSDYEEFAQNSSIFALDNFSLEKFVKLHIALYDEILSINPILRP